MAAYTPAELSEILAKHAAWLRGAAGGTRANLTDANLTRADLRGAYLTRANLTGAYLRGAYLTDAEWEATPEEIERLDAVREIVLAKPERLRMDTWHSDEWTPDHTPEEERTCGSAHCIAGWLQALSPDPAIRVMEAEAAGRKLAPVAAGLFYADDDTVLGWFKERMYANGAAV